MSIAGIRSNRGDGYQTLVAFDWALLVLSNPAYEWIEIDSVTWTVDDVVIGKNDGTQICCQCKKNQVHFKAWEIADIADELDKAFGLLSKNPTTQIRFYSRSPFASLAKLREYSTNYANQTDYAVGLTPELKKTDDELARRITHQAAHLSTSEFLHRTRFETSPELDHMQELLRDRLRNIASNSAAAYDALWTRLDQLGARMEGYNNSSVSAQHRLTKNDLKAVLCEAGAMLAPAMEISEIRTSFANTSVIGRSWHRDIAGERISSSIVDNVLTAIDSRTRAILLTGLPGSGKTCVMLAVQEALEDRAKSHTDVVPLFIQSREFADLATASDRQAQGLHDQWVEKVARMAEDAHVVVVIDSLDVLSISRVHNVLTYFLTQIDRLRSISNVTVLTACRDFDRHYDRRIAEREWDCVFTCLPLDWGTEVSPLLSKLGIQTTSIDSETRDLIRNPRELALFVDLAQRQGSFNVVTSQALAQRYLSVVVQADDALGEAAMQAIEAIAEEMLKSRSLAVPRQRFTASPAIKRILLSNNILHETQDEKLAFGHQTLLDVLVISGAIRQGVTLHQFIQGLPPVPFVRPSIRSFISQLATGERRDFRKQLRAVLMGDVAFHVRRLVAESFAEQKPHDEDWPLIRDLRDKSREVFQVIYSQATLIEWHRFWFKHLVPILKDSRDSEGLTTHVHRLSQWKNDDAAGVIEFWIEVLKLDWVDTNLIADRLGVYVSDIDPKKSELIAPLLKILLDRPRPEYGFLGRAIAHGVAEGGVDDELLWRYIAGEIKDSDALEYRFGRKLHCQPHEFGDRNDKFLLQRMRQSTKLLDHALDSIEHWSQIKQAPYGKTSSGYWRGFLHETSYNDAHTQTDHHHVDSERILMDAIEAGIVHNAKIGSDWWKIRRERLCLSDEGALRYFVIVACNSAPLANLDLVKRILCDKLLLESDLSYELGTLIQTAFMHLSISAQDEVLAEILSLYEESDLDESRHAWILRSRAMLILTIPCYLRSPDAQEILDAHEKLEGVLIRRPNIGLRGGMVSAPFSFEIFLTSSDEAVLNLLKHYSGYEKSFDDFLIGGEREVSGQLREAASRHPMRFLNLLNLYWNVISKNFRDDAMEGVANYLAYRYGNLQPNENWKPIDCPDASVLAQNIFDELERHPAHWQCNRSASNALQACANVIEDMSDAARLVFLAIGFENFREESSIRGDSIDFVQEGINMTGGHVVEALMILTSRLQEKKAQLPELLLPTLRRFAQHEYPAIRSLILRRLPYLQSQDIELGWELFQLATKESRGLWRTAEPCLYYSYYHHFDRVSPLLGRIPREGNHKDLKTWGRISALASLSGRVDFSVLIDQLNKLDATEAWHGAASVWTHAENLTQYKVQCVAGIEAGLNAHGTHAAAMAQKMSNFFRGKTSPISIPADLLKRCFVVFENDVEKKGRDFFGFDEWLNATAHRDPELALTITEIYLDYVIRVKTYLYNHENNLTQLLTRLFAEAEEREETDHGVMLRRVVVVQDVLLGLGVDGINNWLKAAERP